MTSIRSLDEIHHRELARVVRDAGLVRFDSDLSDGLIRRLARDHGGRARHNPDGTWTATLPSVFDLLAFERNCGVEALS